MDLRLQKLRTLAGAIARPKFKEYGWLLAAAIRPGSDVIDVGANVGHFSRHFCGSVGKRGRVIACEPGSFARWVLEARARITGLGNLNVLPFAVSDTCGVAVLYSGTKVSGKFNHTGSSLRPRTRWKRPLEEIVTTVTIDRLVEVCSITDLSLIKIDAEGAERLILNGATAAIAKFKPVVVTEVRDDLLRQFGSSGDRVWAAMKRAGYLAFDIERGRLTPLSTAVNGPHVTFIHADSHLLGGEAAPLSQGPAAAVCG